MASDSSRCPLHLPTWFGSKSSLSRSNRDIPSTRFEKTTKSDISYNETTERIQSASNRKSTPRVLDDANTTAPAICPATQSDGPLIRLSLAKLAANDTTELKRLLRACRDLGGFYLDLRGSELGEEVLKDVDELYQIGTGIFNLSEGEKREYDMNKFGGYYGYKGYRNRTHDLKEFYTVAKDDILSMPCPSSQSTRPQPDQIHSSDQLIKSHIYHSHAVISLLLRNLTDLLNLPSGTLENIHRHTACSGDQLRWIKIQPSQESRTIPSDNILLDEHCDSNSITLLFNRLGGLQVRARQPCKYPHLDKDSGDDYNDYIDSNNITTEGEGNAARWIPADPLPGHCVILLGEQIGKLTHGIFRPGVHRVCVLPSSSSERPTPRYSLGYFSRPEDDVILKQLAGVTVVPRPILGSRRSRNVFNFKDWSGKWGKKTRGE